MITLSVYSTKTWKQKIIGLIGSSKPYALLLETRFGIHTFGVPFPIDVVILDDSFTIVSLKTQLLPARIYLWKPIWKYVLELPSGTIVSKNLHIGQKVSLKILN